MKRVLDSRTGNVSLTFSKREKELLKKTVVGSPCSACNPRERAACCGCAKYTDWEYSMREYRLYGIVDIALDLQHIRDIGKSLGLQSYPYLREVQSLSLDIVKFL